MSVPNDTTNVTFDAPNAMEQDKDIPYIDIKPLSFNIDADVVDQYQPCKLEDTYQNCTTESTNYDEEGDKASQYCTISLKEERHTNLHIEDSKAKEIESFILASGLNSADLELEPPATNADNPVPTLLYPGSYHFKDESPLSESKYHDIKLAMRSESGFSDLQTVNTRSEHIITDNVKQEKNSTGSPDLQTVSDNGELVRMSELDLQTTSDEMLLDTDSPSTPQVSTYKMLPCNVKLLRIPRLDLQSHSGVLHFKVEDLHENIKPGCTRKISCRESHTITKPYKCQQCDSRFTQKGSLAIHVRKHTDSKPYKCELCDFRFSKKCNLVTHIRIHTGIKPYKCDQCESRFTQKQHLVTHILKHTGIKPYKCELCDSRYTRKYDLVIHVRKHSGTKPYKCEHCGSQFSQKCNLLRHIRKHTGIKPYNCEICDSRFTQKYELVIHVRKHSGTKPYKCEQCGSRFSQKCNLLRHIQTHTGIKPYKCEYCDSQFAQKGNLVNHVRIHTGSKPYKCQHCDSRFTRKDSLVIHIRKHTVIKP